MIKIFENCSGGTVSTIVLQGALVYARAFFIVQLVGNE
jgi:hypothetical protein